MKAIGYHSARANNAPQSLVEVDLPRPSPQNRDLLVRVDAISVNPIDFKIRQNVPAKDSEFKVLGWDAVGEVIEVGKDCQLYQVGDKVFYSGDLSRSGSNTEYQLVDERLCGRKPKSLSAIESAALPLTSITAWEILFDHLSLPTKPKSEDSSATILVVGAAGGVGSILLQLAKTLCNATVIATASRQESQSWVRSLGADYVIDHTKSLRDQIDALDIKAIDHVVSLSHTDLYYEDYISVIEPFGKIVLIDDPKEINVMKAKRKSLSVHVEFMFAKSMFSKDMSSQGELLNEISKLIDENHLKTTVGNHLGGITVENVRRAHELLESGKTIGKIVLG
ncbi:MAG: zinc-binding alcohol dehydrogenase family protein [Pseudobacteriovorax sp.]|nr:zinc-binding alcohol dehydrogenase family protein [Pseudobacteriovorax sp.]